MAKKTNRVVRFLNAGITAYRMPKAPDPLEVGANGNKRLYRNVLAVAAAVNKDMGESCAVVRRSSDAIGSSMTGVSKSRVVSYFDSNSVRLTEENIKATAAFLLDPDALIELGRFQAIFPGLPFAEQARLLEPLARGETLIGAGDPLIKRTMTLYHAEQLSIPPVLQHLSEVPPVRGLFAFASEFARYFINATQSFEGHKIALEDMKMMNEELAALVKDLADRFGEQERARLASFAQIEKLLEQEENLIQAAQYEKDVDRTLFMDERARVVAQLAEQMSVNTYAELETMDADARSLQILGVQLDSEQIRKDLFKQVLMDYRVMIISHRALNTTLNLIQRFLMGATLAVRELQASYIMQRLSGANDVYLDTKSQMQMLLSSFESQFLDIDGDGVPDTNPFEGLLEQPVQPALPAEPTLNDDESK